MPNVKIERYHGEPALMIDGRPYPPMAITLRTENRRYLRALGEVGFRIFYISTTTNWNNPGNKVEDYPYADLDRRMPENGIQAVMRALTLLSEEVPEAYVILRLNVSPPPEWVNAHPSEQVTFSDGTRRPVLLTTVSRGEKVDGMLSLCSESWRRDAAKALEDYFDELSQSPLFERVIGFFLCAGGTSEWYYPQKLVTEDGAYGDFSQPFQRAFSAFLREKYGSEERLRQAWHQPEASVEEPLIPPPAQRSYVDEAYQRTCRLLQAGHAVRKPGEGTEDYPADAPCAGLFLNVNALPHVADFYEAWHRATADTVIYFAGILKGRFPHLAVGAFYGACGCTDYFDGSTCTGTPRILNAGVVDFLAAPGVYNNRDPGGIIAQREMQDSFRLHNRIFVDEADNRTHRIGLWAQRESMGLYTAADTLKTLKREFARDLCEDIHGWWFDMGGEWYNAPEILALFRRQQEVARYAYSLDRTKRNEIALIYDCESVHHVARSITQQVMDFYRTSDLGRIGAPVDYYFHDDLSDPSMPDYKLYLMVNQYCLTDTERETVFAKARKNHATVVWLYAAGYINEDVGRVMDTANMEKTIGMGLRRFTAPMFPYFKVNPTAHPAVRLASSSRKYGYIDRPVYSTVWPSPSVLPIPFVDPGFSVADPTVTVLGRYCHDGSPALAMKEQDGFVSVYCGAPVLRSDLIASLAEWAGCHLYLYTDDVLYANESFVAVHAGAEGTKTLYFKHPCSPYEVYEEQYYGHDVSSIEVPMALGETKLWSLQGECRCSDDLL